MRQRVLALCIAVGMLTIHACSSGRGDAETSSKEAWRLVLNYDGSEVMLPLERMDVYLVEDEETYPEVFEIYGPSVTMVGTFPMSSHVGYDENWQVLFGKSIAISPRGGAYEEKDSFIQMPGKARMRIVGGAMVSDKLSGKFSGSEGDQTLSGTITLRVMTDLGEEEITGRFAVHCVAWG